VGQEYSKTYDFESVEIIKGNSSSEAAVGGEVHVKHYNPTWDNVKVFKDYAVVEKSTHVTISADISKFPGAKNPKWTITNLSNPEINDIYYNNMWLTYIFQDAGNYSIQLEAEDTYNNKNVVRRNMIKVK
jgi:PKD repeat protein